MQFNPDLTPTQRIEALIKALRAEDLPNKFRWEFTTMIEAYEPAQTRDCGSTGCALGLGIVMGLLPGEISRFVAGQDEAGDDIFVSDWDYDPCQLRKFMGMTEGDYHNIFFDPPEIYGDDDRHLGERRVIANRLEKLLANRAWGDEF